MFLSSRNHVKTVGQPPGTAIYTGEKSHSTRITTIHYSEHSFKEFKKKNVIEPLPITAEENTWIQVEGLQDVALIEKLATVYGIHPLTLEDILNVDQRPKVEEFEQYAFITLKMLVWHPQKKQFSTEHISFVLGRNYIISFQDNEKTYFKAIQDRLGTISNQRMRQHGPDYLAYRLMDSVIDYYFVVLEALGDQIEDIEDLIIKNPQPANTHTIYQLKSELMVLRKSVWPMREAISHLLQLECDLITPFTRIYFRDLYDHVVQAIDTTETYRDILASMLDVYLSSLTTRMNETMKTLTIISTIFIPITFIASLYGMNFVNMPELQWYYGYYIALGMMACVVFFMLNLFRKKKWL